MNQETKPKDPEGKVPNSVDREVLTEDYVRFVSHIAADIAEQRASRRENVYRAILGLVFGAIAFLGYSSITSVKDDPESVR